MKKFFWTLLIVLLSAKGVVAADLEAYIRLESQKTGADPLPILVLVKTNSVIVENNLKLTLANGWSVDSSIATTSSGLPSGVSPLPLIGGGIGSGQNIDLSINDLAAGTQYGFFITSGIGFNPSVGNKTWLVATNGDSMKVNVPVTTNDTVSVTGKVAALASDFQIGIISDKSTDLTVDEVVTFEITYGSYLLNLTKPLVITGNWTRGTVSGSPTPSVDIVDYVIGSGTTGFGGVLPVIDLLNNKITWTINSFPANTLSQKVSFQLRVNHSYTGQSRVSFETSAILSGANVVTTNSLITNYFLPPALPTATATPILTIAPTPTEQPSDSSNTETTLTNVTPRSTSPTVTPTMKVQINKIEIVKVTTDEIGIVVTGNTQIPEIKIVYGKTIGGLNKSITSINNLKSDLLNLDGLLPDTSYYFKILVTDGSGKIISSDIYTFRTASKSEGPTVDNQSLVVSINNNVVLDASEEKNLVNSVVIVPNHNYAFRINLKKSELVKNVRVLVKNSQVLGINTVYGAEPNSFSVDLEQIVNGGFVGHLISPSIPGFYDVVLRVEDKNGGIVEDKVGILRVVDFIKVKDDKSKPIENAQVWFKKFNLEKRIYELMSPQSIGIKNPSFTESDGTLNLSLPSGKYQVEVSAIGYGSTEKEFVVGLGDEEKLPEIYLEKKPTSILILGSYFTSVSSDVGKFLSTGLDNLLGSTRFFNLLNLLVLLSLVVVGWFIFHLRIIDWWQNLNKKSGVTWGKVVDEETNYPISGAVVYLLDAKLNKVLGKSITNYWGRFEIEIGTKNKYKVAITKSGYESSQMEDFSEKGLEMGNLILKMENIVTPIEKAQIISKKIIARAGKSIWFTWLVLLLIFEILFWGKMGWSQTGWWVVLSWVTVVGWLKI